MRWMPVRNFLERTLDSIPALFLQGSDKLPKEERKQVLLMATSALVDIAISAPDDKKEKRSGRSRNKSRKKLASKKGEKTVTQIWHTAKEAGGSVMSVFPDLAKAFDSISHSRMIKALSDANIA